MLLHHGNAASGAQTRVMVTPHLQLTLFLLVNCVLVMHCYSVHQSSFRRRKEINIVHVTHNMNFDDSSCMYVVFEMRSNGKKSKLKRLLEG